jgi:hypothetical protein
MALTALTALGLSGAPVHEPVHDLPQRAPDANYGALPCTARVAADLVDIPDASVILHATPERVVLQRDEPVARAGGSRSGGWGHFAGRRAHLGGAFRPQAQASARLGFSASDAIVGVGVRSRWLRPSVAGPAARVSTSVVKGLPVVWLLLRCGSFIGEIPGYSFMVATRCTKGDRLGTESTVNVSPVTNGAPRQRPRPRLWRDYSF